MAEAGADKELVQCCIDGDPGAWEVLVRGHVDLLYRSVRKVLALGSGATAEGDIQDVLQSLFLKLWEDDRRRLRTWQGRSRLSTWLVTVARREALVHLERQKRACRSSLPPQSGNGALPSRLLGDVAAGPLSDLEAAETARRVQDAVSRLPMQDNLLVRLIYFDEVSYKDAARVLNVPLNSVSPLLGRARRRLAGLLRKG